MHLEEDVNIEVLEGEVEQLLDLLRASTGADGITLRARAGSRTINVSVGEIGADLADSDFGDPDFEDPVGSSLRSLPDGREVAAVRIAEPDGWIIAIGQNRTPFSADHRQMIETAATLIAKQFQNERTKQQLTHQLDVSNRELEQFAYLAAHEVVAPLRAVVVYAQLLDQLIVPGQTGVDDAELRACVEEIRNGVSLMDRQLKNLRALATVSADVADPVPCDLNAIVRHAIDTHTKCIKASSGTVVCDDLPTVRGGIAPLERVFGNLLSNAVRYRDPDRALTIRITAEAVASSWIVRVIDNGAGVDEEDRFRIFELFERASDTSAGSGIGLPLSRRIIEGFGGAMGVHSNPEGGVTFWLEFPQLDPEDQHQAVA